MTESHPKSKIRRSYTCSVCGKKLSSSVALNAHLNIHSGIKSFCCEYCGALYSTKQNLIAHLSRIHDVNIDSIKSCDICGKQFFRKSAFDTHYLIHLNQKPFKCHICNRYFRQKVTRDEHVATHTGDYKYSCSKCGKKFTSTYKHKEHMLNKRGLCIESLYQPRAGDLNSNNNKRDGFINPLKFDCDVTEKLLDFNLNQGEAIKFFCAMPQCSEISFKNKTVLKKHISKTHYPIRCINQNEPFESINIRVLPSEKTKSQTCEKPCYNLIRGNLKKRHSIDSSNSAEFTCEECNKHFKSLKGLKYHKRAHNGGYNFICEICGKLFVRNSHFVSHMRTHSNMRPFCCTVCRKTYKSKKNLKEHIRIKHST